MRVHHEREVEVRPLRVPYECGICSKLSADEGQPVLTLDGLQPTYIRPPTWTRALNIWLCPDCAGDNREAIWAERVAIVKMAVINAVNDYISESSVVVFALQAIIDDIREGVCDVTHPSGLDESRVDK